MRKDHLRDYVTNAFRAYAAEGCPTYEDLRQNIINDITRSSSDSANVHHHGISKPTEAAIMAAENRLDNAMGQMADILACIRTIDIIEKHQDGEDIKYALRCVYFINPSRVPPKGEISERVKSVAAQKYVDERTVYRWLGTARKIFSVERGLNVVSSST